MAVATRSTGSGRTSATKRMSLADVKTSGGGLPGRYVIHGPEGVGKTSFGAQMPSPVFVQTKGETGLETLLDSGRLDGVSHFPECPTWGDLLGAIDELANSEHNFKTLVIDTANGAERLCHEEVCQRDYAGKWGKDGFTSYFQGYDVSLADWRNLLNSLDELRRKRQMAICCLCHTKVAPFKNPEGPDFDRYQPDMHHKTWGLTHKWADAVLFLNYETFVDESGARAKGAGGRRRMLYTERHAAYDAKNRHGLPEEIDLGGSPAEAWANFTAALKAGRTSRKEG